MITGYLDSALMTIFIVGVVLVVFNAARRWIAAAHGVPAAKEAFGEPVNSAGEIKMGCC
jgi:hypothetical protein